MTDKTLSCSNCSNRTIKPEYLFCPYCKYDLRNKQIPTTLDGISQILSNADELTSEQVSIIYKILQVEASKNPTDAHLLEEKTISKFLLGITNFVYTVGDLASISKKLLMFKKLPFARAY